MWGESVPGPCSRARDDISQMGERERVLWPLRAVRGPARVLEKKVSR